MATVRELITKIVFKMDSRGLDQANRAMTQFRQGAQNAGNGADAGARRASSSFGKLSGMVGKATNDLGRLRRSAQQLGQQKATVKVNADTREAESKLSRLRSRMSGVSAGSGFGADLAGAVGLGGISAGAIAGAGVLAAGAAAAGAVKTFADFDATMSKVRALTKASGEDMRDLTATARKLGASTKYSATEAAEAMTYLGMAGWKTKEIIAGMPGLLNLAAASGMDLATTADIVSDDLTAFHMGANQAGHMADVMAAASTNANTNVGLMGATFKYAGAVAGSLGYSLEDVALATGLMANAGIKGEMAGTALRSVMTRLIDPPKEAAEALDGLGITAKNADGTVKPFRQQLKELRKAFAGLSKAEQAEKASSIAGLEAMSGFLSVITASEGDFGRLEAAIDNSSGAADDMAATMNDNLQGSLKELGSVIAEVALSFGEVLEPSARNAVNGIKDAFSGLASWLSPYMTILRGPIGDTTEALEESRNEIAQLEGEHPTFMKLIELFKQIGENIDKAGTSIENFGQKLSEAFGNETVNSGVQKLIEVLTAIEKFRGASIDATGLFGATPLGMFSHLIVEATKAGAEIVSEIMKALGELVTKGIEKLGELARSIAETASKLITSFGEAIGQINAMFNGMADNAIAQINSIAGALISLEKRQDSLRIRLGADAAAYNNLTNNTANVTNNITVKDTNEATRFAGGSVAGFNRGW